MAERGAFRLKGAVAQLAYWHLTGGPKPGGHAGRRLCGLLSGGGQRIRPRRGRSRLSPECTRGLERSCTKQAENRGPESVSIPTPLGYETQSRTGRGPRWAGEAAGPRRVASCCRPTCPRRCPSASKENPDSRRGRPCRPTGGDAGFRGGQGAGPSGCSSARAPPCAYWSLEQNRDAIKSAHSHHIALRPKEQLAPPHPYGVSLRACLRASSCGPSPPSSAALTAAAWRTPPPPSGESARMETATATSACDPTLQDTGTPVISSRPTRREPQAEACRSAGKGCPACTPSRPSAVTRR